MNIIQGEHVTGSPLYDGELVGIKVPIELLAGLAQVDNHIGDWVIVNK